MAFAFARLAAMAAAILDFLGTLGVAEATAPTISGLGHALSSCLRAVPSRASNIAKAQSCHTASKDQNMTLAVSLTAGLGSARAFLTDFSRTSSPPLASMECLERKPCVSM